MYVLDGDIDAVKCNPVSGRFNISGCMFGNGGCLSIIDGKGGNGGCGGSLKGNGGELGGCGGGGKGGILAKGSESIDGALTIAYVPRAFCSVVSSICMYRDTVLGGLIRTVLVDSCGSLSVAQAKSGVVEWILHEVGGCVDAILGVGALGSCGATMVRAFGCMGGKPGMKVAGTVLSSSGIESSLLSTSSISD